MAKFTIIGDVTLELRHQIYSALATATDPIFNLPTEAQAVFIGPPDADTIDARAVAALYLYHLTPSKHLRNQRPLPDPIDPSRFRRPPLPLELRYLAVPLVDSEVGHQHLGRILQHFNDQGTFSTVDGLPIGDSFGGAANEFRVSIDPLTIEQLGHIWSGFGESFRLSIGLLVEVVAIDSALPPDAVPRVDELHLLTGVRA